MRPEGEASSKPSVTRARRSTGPRSTLRPADRTKPRITTPAGTARAPAAPAAHRAAAGTVHAAHGIRYKAVI